jgi:death-on-curing family protein
VFEAESGVLYLEIEDVFAIYAELFACSDQEAADQLRSRDGLESALARPLAYAFYEAADLSLQAAALAHGIAEGQYFLDGNKRVALSALSTFLLANGYLQSASQVERIDWMLNLSRGSSLGELAERIRRGLVAMR